MPRGRPAPASVYLCFLCLLALMAQPAAKLCSTGLLIKVNVLIKKAPGLRWLNSTLYTPTTDVYLNCPRATLKCFADEIKVLSEEWQMREVSSMQKLNIRIEKLANEVFNERESGCLQCELLEEKNAETFLNELKKTLEMMNNQQIC